MTIARRVLGATALVTLPLAALGVFVLLPLGAMLRRGVWPGGHFDPGAVWRTLTAPQVLRVLWFTVWTAGIATIVALLLGVVLAYACYRLRFPGRGLVRTIAIVPFALPTVVVGIAFTRLFDPGGLFGGLGWSGTPAAIVIGLAFMNIGLVMRTVGAHWESLDVRREQAAAALGATPRQVFVSVTLPALLPSVLAAASVVFLFCATSFGIVLTMGGLRYSNVETEIYLLTTQELDLTSAAALSLVQILIIVALLVVIGRLRRRGSVVDRRVAPPRRPQLRDVPVLAVAAVVIAALLVPVASLLSASLRRDGSWSLDNYRALARPGATSDLPSVTAAIGNSFGIAAVATVLALVLGGLVAYVVSRRPAGRLARRLVSAFDGAFMLPLGVSAVTVGFGFLITLNRPPLDLRTSQVLIPIAQAMVALPLVVRTVAPVWRGIDDRQRQAAASLGAGPWRVFRTVDLAAGWRPFLAAAGFALAVSLGEFGATSFLARSDQPTLPVLIYRLMGHPGVDNFGLAMAASTILAGTAALAMLLVEGLRVSATGTF